MPDLEITIEMTKEDDIKLEIPNGFPMLYVGRGTYTSALGIRSQAVLTDGANEVHLIYIGRYTSIGDNLKILCDFNHDYHSVYMGIISDYGDNGASGDYRKKVGQTINYMKEKGMIVIGNDVWIGNDVTLIADVRIGNGAVIGARSVITKDVPPYTIWAGNPAVQVGTRFDEDTIRKLQEISWWEFTREKLLAIKEDMQGDPHVFARKYWNPELCLKEKENTIPQYLAFVDVKTDFSTFGGVVEGFARKFSEGGAKLILCYKNGSEDEKELVDSLCEALQKLPVSENIDIYGIDDEDEEMLIATADYMVLGRDIKNIMRISYAFKHGTRIISGVNKPIIWN
jgi:virginiamycin A acetyltransferase